jgi:hypothetical protein
MLRDKLNKTSLVLLSTKGELTMRTPVYQPPLIPVNLTIEDMHIILGALEDTEDFKSNGDTLDLYYHVRRQLQKLHRRENKG